MKPGMKAQNVEAKVDKRTLTAVIGNLEGIGSLAQAQAWLKDKLTVLHSRERRRHSNFTCAHEKCEVA